MSDAPKLQVDDDWKAQAQQEKERLASEAKLPAVPPPSASPAAVPPTEPSDQPAQSKAPPPLPPATFESIVEQYATQVLFALGAIPHPATGKRQRDLEVAKHYIDLLGVLETKTKGNLTPQEEQLLNAALYQMRMNYVNALKSR